MILRWMTDAFKIFLAVALFSVLAMYIMAYKVDTSGSHGIHCDDDVLYYYSDNVGKPLRRFGETLSCEP